MLDNVAPRQRFVGYVHGDRRWPEGSLRGSSSRLRSRRGDRHLLPQARPVEKRLAPLRQHRRFKRMVCAPRMWA